MSFYSDWRRYIMAIDPEETKNLLFGGFKNSKRSAAVKQEIPITKEDGNFGTSKLPKWKTLEKVTILLTPEQKDCIDDMARKIMRFRQKAKIPLDEKERITANSVVRALLDNFMSQVSGLELQHIHTEEDLKHWISTLFRECKR